MAAPIEQRIAAGRLADVIGSLRTAKLLSLRFWAFPAILSVVLLVIAQLDFVIFHTLAEFFAIVVALVMFALAWYTSPLTRNHFLIFLACGYFWIGALDLAHTLAYRGLELFPYSGTNASSQLWIVTRYHEAALLLLAPLLASRGINKRMLFVANGAVAVLLASWVFSGAFPDTFVEGSGLTPFKIVSEYVIIAVLIAAIFALLRWHRPTNPSETTLLVTGISLTIATELAFTVYADPFDVANKVGHILKLLSFWVIFQAIVASNLRKPYVDLQNALVLAHRNAEAAERANRAKSDFLSMMSHDLRTPLNAVIGFSDMMRSETFGPLGHPKYREYSEAIQKSGTHLLSLINDILDLSKIESGHYNLQDEVIDVGTLLRDIPVGVSAEIPMGSHPIELAIPLAAPHLRGERRALLQILANLVGNAAKFSPVGTPIRIGWQPHKDGSWALSVADQGCGIPADKLTLVTEPFVQGDPHHSRTHGGIGLGLHIVRLLTELHGGRLMLDSAVGVGTTVSVLFPVDRLVPRNATRTTVDAAIPDARTVAP